MHTKAKQKPPDPRILICHTHSPVVTLQHITMAIFTSLCHTLSMSILQRTQNLLLCVVSGSFQFSSQNLLQWLLWLPNEYCINFIIANVTFHTLHSSQPAYLCSALHAHHATCSPGLSSTICFPSHLSTLHLATAVCQCRSSPNVYTDTFHYHVKAQACLQTQLEPFLLHLRFDFS